MTATPPLPSSRGPRLTCPLSQWNFDGSSTGQAPGDNSDVYIKPVAVYPDPFRTVGGDNILVLTECWMSDGTPNKFNHRHEAAKLMEKHAGHKPWFGLEQEYTLLDIADRPFGWVSIPLPVPSAVLGAAEHTTLTSRDTI